MGIGLHNIWKFKDLGVRTPCVHGASLGISALVHVAIISKFFLAREDRAFSHKEKTYEPLRQPDIRQRLA
jgi:hypothetical protein